MPCLRTDDLDNFVVLCPDFNDNTDFSLTKNFISKRKCSLSKMLYSHYVTSIHFQLARLPLLSICLYK